MSRRPTTPLLLLSLSAALTLGCARDLGLPPDLGVPVVTGFTPPAAYSGQLLTISGRGLAGDAASFRVQFGSGASAPGLATAGGTLTVRVPPGAGDGPITVSNARGPGAPFGAFDHLGGGELEVGQVVSTQVMRHDPSRVLSTPDDLFIESRLWGGLVSLLDKYFDGSEAFQAVALPGGTALAWVRPSWNLAHVPAPGLVAYQVVRRDLGGGADVVADLDAPEGALVLMTAIAGPPPRLAVVTTSEDPFGDPMPVRLTALDASTLAVAVAARDLPVVAAWELADAGSGRVVMTADRDLDTGLLLSPMAGPDVYIPELASFSLPNGLVDQGLAVATVTGGHRVAVTFEGEGNLVTADLDVASPVFNPTPIPLQVLVDYPSGLAAAGKWVAVSKKLEDIVLGIDLDTRQYAWSLSTPAPGPAGGDGAFLRVGGAETNDVLEIQAATGILLARRDFGFFPGTASGEGGLAQCDGQACGSLDLRVVTGYPVGVLETSSTAARRIGVGQSLGAILGLANVGDDAWTWSSSWIEGPDGFLDLSGWVIFRVLPDADGAWILHGDGVSRLEGNVVLGTSPLSIGSYDDTRQPVALPGGGVAAAWKDLSGWHVGAWRRADVVAGAAPAPVDLAVEADVMFVSDGVPWVVASGFLGNGSWVNSAVRLDGPPVRVIEEVPLSQFAWDVVAVSPNGRMLVRRTGGGLELLRADPYQDLPLVSTVAVEGTIGGVAFDATGAKAWVVTRVPEALITLQ